MEEVPTNHLLLRRGVERVLEALARSHRRHILIELLNGWVVREDDAAIRGEDPIPGARKPRSDVPTSEVSG